VFNHAISGVARAYPHGIVQKGDVVVGIRDRDAHNNVVISD
jgi:hypothetical protein